MPARHGWGEAFSVEGDIARLYGNGLSTPMEKGAGREVLISKLLGR
jgi:hypothetical protein